MNRSNGISWVRIKAEYDMIPAQFVGGRWKMFGTPCDFKDDFFAEIGAAIEAPKVLTEKEQ